MEKYTLEQAIEKMTEIATNPSLMVGSLFTAENVLGILNSIELPPAKVIREMPNGWQEEVTQLITNFIEEDFNEFVDYDDTEFELDGDRLSVQAVGYSSRTIRSNTRYFVEGNLVELFEPVIDEVEEEHVCETCDKPQTKDEHEFSDICGECREGIDC